MNSEIHPEFRSERKLSALAGVLITFAGCFFLIWGAVLLAVSTGLLPGFKSISAPVTIAGWMLVIATLASGVLLISFARHLLIVFPSWLRRASWLLAHTQPRTMYLDFDPNEQSRGRDALLREGNGARAAESIEIRSPLWKFRDLKPMSVGVCGESMPDGIVVIFAGETVLWGFKSM